MIEGKARNYCLGRKIALEDNRAPRRVVRALKQIYVSMTPKEKEHFLNS